MSPNADAATSVTPVPRRGRPPRISRERVVDAALEIGLERFSMDDIAERLGVTTPALYTHVTGRDEIVRLGAGVVIERGSADAATWVDWQSWLRGWATSLRDELGSVGGELLDVIRDGLDVRDLAVVEQGVALLTDAGLDPTDAGRTLWLATRIAMSAGPSGSSAIGQVARAAQSAAHDSAATPSSVMASAMDAMSEVDNDRAFAFDLEVLVAGVESRLAA